MIKMVISMLHIFYHNFLKSRKVSGMPPTLHPAGCQLLTPPPYTHTHVFHAQNQPSSFYSQRRYLPPIFSPSVNLLKQLRGEGSKLCSADLAIGGFQVGELLTTVTWYNQGTHRVGQPGAAPRPPRPRRASRSVAQSPTSIPALDGISAKTQRKPPKGQTRTKTERDGRGCAECPQRP